MNLTEKVGTGRRTKLAGIDDYVMFLLGFIQFCANETAALNEPLYLIWIPNINAKQELESSFTKEGNLHFEDKDVNDRSFVGFKTPWALFIDHSNDSSIDNSARRFQYGTDSLIWSPRRNILKQDDLDSCSESGHIICEPVYTIVQHKKRRLLADLS